MPKRNSNKINFICPPAPPDKRAYISDIGKILIKDFGKKSYYKPEEVKKAHKKSMWSDGLDFSCWAMSTYSSHEDFDTYHHETDEACDYITMKAEMLEGISFAHSVHLVDLPQIDLDTSWLDIGNVLSGVIEGIGQFFSAIIDG